MWKKPSRPDHAVSQTFNSGVLTVYRVTDAAQPGYKPQPRTAELVTLPYEARTVGVSRYYAAQQAQVQIDRVLRVPDPGNDFLISPQDQAQTADGQTYRIEQVQQVRDVWPPCLDLSLGRIDQIWPAPPPPEPDPDPDPDPQPEEVQP